MGSNSSRSCCILPKTFVYNKHISVVISLSNKDQHLLHSIVVKKNEDGLQL